MKKKFLLIPLLFTAMTIMAHEYVLIAYEYIVKEGGQLELHLFVADGFNIELERPVQKSITKKFELLSENGTTNLLLSSGDGSYPVLNRIVDFRGLGLIHMERDYARIVLPNEDFKNYLKEDNIAHIVIDETGKAEQSERYTRYIKTLVQSNPKANDSLYSASTGHNFEIILLDNPYQLHAGDWLRAKLLFMGKPLANKAVTARNRIGNEASIAQYARTDVAGICSFKLERQGDWFLHATHMIPCPEPEDADWESFWATFSFGIAE